MWQYYEIPDGWVALMDGSLIVQRSSVIIANRIDIKTITYEGVIHENTDGLTLVARKVGVMDRIVRDRAVNQSCYQIHQEKLFLMYHY